MNGSVYRLARRYEAICWKWQSLALREYRAALRVRDEAAERLKDAQDQWAHAMSSAAALRDGADWALVEGFVRYLERLEAQWTDEWEASAAEAERKREELHARYLETETWKALRARLDEAKQSLAARAWQNELDEHAVMREARRSWKPDDLR
ncbi:flagellar FliJ family protein [Alicyclobacillus vulcanalis]|uniref:Flagellar FliJ protein n=1 Tax=Alicyclobacillus vulcanalis TaxID=252246 RepID=A0A1N7MWY7_9BACL|nr:flagellar FliJ family protein [Alicyclobacillus vulcanalis]SIS90610.1 FliJ protein [Alicyclobacillus vulcanalis]